MARGIIDDERDWYKWFKCSDIDPTVLPGEVINRARQKGYGLLFAKRFAFRPLRTFKVLRNFSRHMKTADIVSLLTSPFRKRVLTHTNDLPARMLDRGLKEPIRTVGPDGRVEPDLELAPAPPPVATGADAPESERAPASTP